MKQEGNVAKFSPVVKLLASFSPGGVGDILEPGVNRPCPRAWAMKSRISRKPLNLAADPASSQWTMSNGAETEQVQENRRGKTMTAGRSYLDCRVVVAERLAAYPLRC
jgi:hypothetical protein